MYKVTRFPKANSLADQVCLLATKSNGRDVKVTIDEMIGYINCEKVFYPMANGDIIVSKIDEFHLILDQEGKPLLEIIEVDEVQLGEELP